MNKKVILISLVAVLLLLGGIFYVKKALTPSPSADELVSLSASEMFNPQSERMGLEEPSQDTPASQSLKTSLKIICQGDRVSNFDCYEDHYADLIKTESVDAAFIDLRNRYNENSYVVSQCHPIAHVIGQIAVKKYPTAAEAYTHGDSFCWSGYYHGVLEGIVGKIGQENVIAQINNICGSIAGKEDYSFEYYNCVHGLGHGLMAMTNTELFESLKLCDNLKGNWEQTSCYGGVYMENVMVDNKNHFTNYLKPDDPLYPCNKVDTKYKSACYLMQTSYMLKVTGGDFTKVFSLCATADADFVATCYQSLGRDASGRSVSDVTSTKSTCDMGQDFAAKSNCIMGAVKDFVAYHHSDLQAKEFCHALSTPDLIAICLSTAESYYQSF